MLSIGPMGWLFSRRCWANRDLWLAYLKSRKFSENLVWNDLPVCPTYFILQPGHVSWYTPPPSNLFCLGVDCCESNLPMVLHVVYETFTEELLKSFVKKLVSFP